jgi:uncharacterized protein (DUF1330 family)
MKRAVLLSVAVVLLILSLNGVALAASPQEIYDDYAADRSLDGSYSDGDLQRYLSSATVHQYGDPAVLASLDSVVRILLAADRGASLFTGTQLILIHLAVVALGGGGFALWLLFRRRDLAYFIARIDVRDPEAYERFLKETGPTLDDYDGTVLAIDEAVTVLEGQWPVTRTVLIAFPDEATAQSWFTSREYQDIAQYRLDAATEDAIVMQAVDRNGRGRRVRREPAPD